MYLHSLVHIPHPLRPGLAPRSPLIQNRWLALHGFLDNAATFDMLAPELLMGGASSVVCLDLAGACARACVCVSEGVFYAWGICAMWMSSCATYVYVYVSTRRHTHAHTLVHTRAGHGLSDWRHSGVYYVVDNVADAVYAADALKWDRFSMCAYLLLFTLL